MSDTGDADPQQAATQAVIEVTTFANYLRRVVPVLLEDADDTPEALIITLKDKNTIECMKKFLGDPQVPALFVQRMAAKGIKEHCSCISNYVMTHFLNDSF